MRYIDEALRPLGERLDEPARKRLRCALALTLGTHVVIAMKDSADLDDDEEIVATLEWAATRSCARRITISNSRSNTCSDHATASDASG